MVNNALIFIMGSVFLTLVSLVLDRRKTLMGLKKGWNMFRNIAIPFLNILILVSLLLHVVPPSLIASYLGAGSGFRGVAIAALVGSITLIPAFISYPIAATLIKQGASYTTIATFMTTLMMVGVGRNRALPSCPLTFPLRWWKKHYIWHGISLQIVVKIR